MSLESAMRTIAMQAEALATKLECGAISEEQACEHVDKIADIAFRSLHAKSPGEAVEAGGANV